MAQGVLVIMEQREGVFRKTAFESVSEGRRIADTLNTSLSALVMGSGIEGTAAEIEKYGAGAVVLKSLFEEQINHEIGSLIKNNDHSTAEAYLSNYARENTVSQYISLIETAKKQVEIPVIASINCVSAEDWVSYAKRIQECGADALELNIHIIPTSKSETGKEIEEKYYKIIGEVEEYISIPIAIKISNQFSNILNLIHNFEARDVEGVVLFNRFYEPDLDIKNMKFKSSGVFSTPEEIRHTLRWIAILYASRNKIDISASTGIHDAEAVIKVLLAGADSAQICSVLYQKGLSEIKTIIAGIENWMNEMSFEKISDFKGLLSYEEIKNPAVYERAQFMKYFSGIE